VFHPLTFRYPRFDAINAAIALFIIAILGWRRPLGLRLEFVHFGLSAKYQLTTALGLRRGGDCEAVGEGLISKGDGHNPAGIIPKMEKCIKK
jgi:hypothetical protein